MILSNFPTKTITPESIGAIPNPTSGTAGQVLTKTANGSEWENAPSGLPDGGTEGQMLYKSLDGTEWGDKPNIYVSINYSDGSYSADKTYEEIRQLLLDGFHVFAQYGGRIYVLSGCLLDSSITSIKFFNAVYVSYRALNGSFLVINPDSSISINSFELDFSDYVPVTRSINGNRLNQDVHLSAEDVNAIENPANGTDGQILAKTSSGAAWVDKPESGLTQSEADERYLQLSGGTMTGELTANLIKFDNGLGDEFDYPYLSADKRVLSLGTPGGYVDLKVKETPNSDTDPASKKYVDSKVKAPEVVAIDIRGASSWSDGTITETVSGVSANEMDQLITVVPALYYQEDYYNAGIICTGQAENSLTFTAKNPDKLPSTKFSVYVVIQPLS